MQPASSAVALRKPAGYLPTRRPTLAEVEALALVERYSWRRHTHDPDSYWVSVMQAADILGVSVQRVKQLLDKDFLPYSTHRGTGRG